MKIIFTAADIVQCDELRLFLQSNGIECVIQNEQGATSASLGLPTQPLTPPELWVGDEDYDKALQLVSDFKGRDQTLSEDYGSAPKGTRFVRGILLGFLIAVAAFSFWSIHEKRYTGIMKRDTNGDGKPDIWCHYQSGALTKSEEDQDGDGRVDIWWLYTNGIVSQGMRDADFNGKPDVTTFFLKGRVTKAEWRPNGSQILVKKEIYRHESLVEEWIDDNGDGQFDKVIEYDWMGNITATRKLSSVEQPLSPR